MPLPNVRVDTKKRGGDLAISNSFRDQNFSLLWFTGLHIWDGERRHTYANDVSWLDGTSQDVEHTRLAADAQLCLLAVFQCLNLHLKSKDLTVRYIKKLACSNCEYAVIWTSSTLPHVTPSYFGCSRNEVTYSTYKVTLFYSVTVLAFVKNISMGVSTQKWSH